MNTIYGYIQDLLRLIRVFRWVIHRKVIQSHSRNLLRLDMDERTWTIGLNEVIIRWFDSPHCAAEAHSSSLKRNLQASLINMPVLSAFRIDPNRFRYCAGVRFTFRLNKRLKNPASS